MIKPEVTFLVGAVVKIRVDSGSWRILDTYDTCRVYYVYSGAADFLLGDTVVHLCPDHIYFFPPNLPFRVRSDGDTPFVHTFFDFYMRPAMIGDRVLCFPAEEYPILADLIRTSEKMILQNGAPSFAVHEYTPLVGCLEAILAVIAHERSVSYVCDPVIVGALDKIHAEFRSGLRVCDLARTYGYTEDAFIKKFRSVMKTTPYAYIKSLKQHEARFLRSKGYGTEEVAQMLGYKDSSSLCHAMKERF